jgi:hypothetical protein
MQGTQKDSARLSRALLEASIRKPTQMQGAQVLRNEAYIRYVNKPAPVKIGEG